MASAGGGYGTCNSTGEGQERQNDDEDSGHEYQPQKKRQKTIKKVTFTHYEWWYYYDRHNYTASAVDGGHGIKVTRRGHKQQEDSRKVHQHQTRTGLLETQAKEAPLKCSIQLQQVAENVQQQQLLLTQVQAQLEFIQLMVNTLLLTQLDTTEDATIDTQDNLEADHKGISNLIVKIDHHNQSFDNNTPSNIYDIGFLDAWIPLTLQRHRTKAISSDKKDDRIIGSNDIIVTNIHDNYSITNIEATDIKGKYNNIALPIANDWCNTSTHLRIHYPRQFTPTHCKAWLRNHPTPMHRKAWLQNPTACHWKA